ncbi:MAG: HU family DNA-binding protein [Bacilli bacterium]|nr:HU family DNA-binding protein [Bacilli bacterium]
MKKVELVEKVAEEAGLTKADATKAIDAMIAAITEALSKGDKVPLVGFGTFAVSKRAAREGRNPKTGDIVQIAARNVVTFKPGSALKDAVNE